MPPELAALAQLRLFTVHLLAKGVVVPEPMGLGPQALGLRWLPAELDPTVQAAVQQVALGLPPGLVQRRQGRKTLPISALQQARVLLSLLLDHDLFAGAALAAPTKANSKAMQGKIPQLFFGIGRARFDGPGEAAWPGSIQAWLARLHLARQPVAPLLQLDETADGAGFALSIAVADASEALARPTPLATVIRSAAWQDRRMALLQTVPLLALRLRLAGCAGRSDAHAPGLRRPAGPGQRGGALQGRICLPRRIGCRPGPGDRAHQPADHLWRGAHRFGPAEGHGLAHRGGGRGAEPQEPGRCADQGGTGLNLTAASHVGHFDRWWNPAVEAQATDRAYRIGQQRQVQVHRLIMRSTFEERIDAMIRSKRELADLTVGSGETWIGQLPDDEIRRLFALGAQG